MKRDAWASGERRNEPGEPICPTSGRVLLRRGVVAHLCRVPESGNPHIAMRSAPRHDAKPSRSNGSIWSDSALSGRWTPFLTLSLSRARPVRARAAGSPAPPALAGKIGPSPAYTPRARAHLDAPIAETKSLPPTPTGGMASLTKNSLPCGLARSTTGGNGRGPSWPPTIRTVRCPKRMSGGATL